MIINLLLHPTILYLIFIMNSFVIHPSILVSLIFLSSLSLFFFRESYMCVFRPPKRSFFFLCFFLPVLLSFSPIKWSVVLHKRISSEISHKQDKTWCSSRNYIRSVCIKKTYTWRLPLLLFQEKEWKEFDLNAAADEDDDDDDEPSLEVPSFLLACLFSRREFWCFHTTDRHIPSHSFTHSNMSERKVGNLFETWKKEGMKKREEKECTFFFFHEKDEGWKKEEGREAKQKLLSGNTIFFTSLTFVCLM